MWFENRVLKFSLQARRHKNKRPNVEHKHTNAMFKLEATRAVKPQCVASRRESVAQVFSNLVFQYHGDLAKSIWVIMRKTKNISNLWPIARRERERSCNKTKCIIVRADKITGRAFRHNNPLRSRQPKKMRVVRSTKIGRCDCFYSLEKSVKLRL